MEPPFAEVILVFVDVFNVPVEGPGNDLEVQEDELPKRQWSHKRGLCPEQETKLRKQLR